MTAREAFERAMVGKPGQCEVYESLKLEIAKAVEAGLLEVRLEPWRFGHNAFQRHETLRSLEREGYQVTLGEGDARVSWDVSWPVALGVDK